MRRQRKSRVNSAVIKGLTPFGRGFDGTLGADATFVRATTATVEDHESVIREVLSGEARFQGQRRVYNLITVPEDFNDPYWVVFTSGDGTSEISADGKSITFTVTSTGRATINNTYTGKLGASGVLSVDQLINSGAISVQNIRLVATNATVNSSDRITVSDTFTGGADIVRFGLGVEGDETSACSVTYSFPQLQDKTGASDPTVPDDYVSTGVGVGSSSAIGDNSDFTDSLGDWYAGTTGTLTNPSNTMEVANSTTATGRGVLAQTLIVGRPYILSAELSAGVNSPDGFLAVSGNSDGSGSHTFQDFTADGTLRNMLFIATAASQYMVMQVDSTVTGDSIIIDNVTVRSADHGVNVDGVKYFLTDNGNTVTSNVVTEAVGSAITGEIGYFGERAATNSILHSRDITNAAWLKTNAPTAVLDEIGIDGKANTACTTTDNSANAESFYQDITISNDNAVHAVHNYILQDNDETRFPEFDLSAIGGTPQQVATQVNTKTGAKTNRAAVGTVTSSVEAVSLGGRSWWKLTQTVQNNTSGNTSLRRRFYSALGTTFGVFDAAAQGSCVVDSTQIELNQSFTTSDIFTTTAAVTRNKDDLSYPTTYIPVNDCVFSFDWTPTAENQAVASSIVLFSSYTNSGAHILVYVSNNTTLRFRKTISSISYDGDIAISYSAGTKYNIKARADSSEGIDIWLDGTKGSTDTNTVDMILSATLDIGLYNTGFHQTGGINNFKVHSGTFTDAEVTSL